MNIDLEDEDQYIPSKARRPGGAPSGKTVQKAPVKGAKRTSQAELYRTALRFFRSKNRKQLYPAIIDHLTSFVENSPDHIPSLKMLAYSLAETGQFRDAFHYFKNVLQINKNDTEALNAVAFLSLESGRTEESINHLLDAIYVDGNDERLKKNLEKLRNIRDAKLFFSMTRPSDFIFFELPAESFSVRIAGQAAGFFSGKNGKTALIVAAIAIVVIAIYLVYPAFSGWSHNVRYGLGGGAKMTHVTIQDIDRLVQEREKYSLKLSENQIKEKFALARTCLEEKRRNQAVILINELLNSNASDAIKERVRMLKEFIPDPQRGQIDFNPDVREVVKTPFIYENVSVQWEGTAANLEYKGRDETVIDLLINFVDKATVEGIAEIHFPGYREIDNGKKFSVFGVITGVTVDNQVAVRGLDFQVIRR